MGLEARAVGGAGSCPVGRVPAGEIEGAVIDQLRAVFRQPEIVAGTWKAARAHADDISEADARAALQRLDPLWDELFLADRQPRSGCDPHAGGSGDRDAPRPGGRGGAGRSGVPGPATRLYPPTGACQAMTRILTITGLSKGFHMHHLGQQIAAFDGVDFHVNAGEFVLLKGRNGAGKSTLLRTIYRSYLADAGQIAFASDHGMIDLARAADVDILHLRATEIGFVTQFLQARPRVSAEALVAEPLRRAGHGADQALEQARHWLAVFGVKPELWRA